MIDIYSMGNIFYAILTGKMPFEGVNASEAQKKVVNGERPTGMKILERSDDVAIQSLIFATKKCWEQEPKDRPTAALIRDELKKGLDKMRMENATKESLEFSSSQSISSNRKYLWAPPWFVHNHWDKSMDCSMCKCNNTAHCPWQCSNIPPHMRAVENGSDCSS